jgi:hypothetical protein
MPISRIKTDGIQDDAITSAKIGVDVIVADDLAANSVTVSELTDGAVTSAKLDTNIAVTGTLSSGSSMTATGEFKANGGAVFNEDSTGVDFRVESLNDANMFFVDGGNDKVGIGTSSPASLLTLKKTNAGGDGAELRLINSSTTVESATQLVFTNTTTDSANSAVIKVARTAGGQDFRFSSDGTERMRIDSSGKVGIGGAASVPLHIQSSGQNANVRVQASDNGYASILQLYANNVSGASYNAIQSHVNGDGTVQWEISGPKASAEDQMLFHTGGSERMRIDSSGNLLVGKTAGSNTTKGSTLTQTGEIVSTITTAGGASQNIFLNRQDADGTAILFRRANGTVGNIGTNSSRLYIAGDNAGFKFRADLTCIMPCNSDGSNSDNDLNLGQASVRWSTIFATNSTINTSDRNEKQDIEELSDAEQRVAVACKGLMRKYRWKSSVAEKGDNARTHFGIIAQDLQDAFTAEGLDASKYAMFCSDTWWELDGEIYQTEEEAPDDATEKTRLGVRYNQLLAFIISAL